MSYFTDVWLQGFGWILGPGAILFFVNCLSEISLFRFRNVIGGWRVEGWTYMSPSSNLYQLSEIISSAASWSAICARSCWVCLVIKQKIEVDFLRFKSVLSLRGSVRTGSTWSVSTVVFQVSSSSSLSRMSVSPSFLRRRRRVCPVDWKILDSERLSSSFVTRLELFILSFRRVLEERAAAMWSWEWMMSASARLCRSRYILLLIPLLCCIAPSLRQVMSLVDTAEKLSTHWEVFVLIGN